MTSGIGLAAAALVLAGCASDTETTTTESGVELVEDGVLTICTHLPYEPFEFTEGGEVVGFDIDVLDIAAQAEGLDTKVVDTSWETIVSGEALNTGQCDVAAGAMTITDEREAVMDFAEPYFEAKQALLMKIGRGLQPRSRTSPARPSRSRTPPPAPSYVRENAPEDAEIISFEDSALMQQAVKSGAPTPGSTTTACSTTSSARTPTSRSSPSSRPATSYGFSVKKDGNDELISVIDDAIASDEYDAAYEKWFGTTAS